MTITNQFEIQIVATTDGVEQILAPALSAAVTAWDRDLNDTEDNDADGFLVSDTLNGQPEPSDDDEEEGDGDEGEDEDDGEEAEAIGSLSLTATLNKEVLADLNYLQEKHEGEMLTIRVVYGNDTVGKVVRSFEVSSDLSLLIAGGSKSDDPLVADVLFDVYDSALNY